MADLRRRAVRPPLVAFMDEGRFGRISDLRRCWAPGRIRPKVPRQVVRQSLYSFVAVAPREALLVHTLAECCHTPTMSLFLLELLRAWPDHPIVLFLDRAGWHLSRHLPVPERLHLVHLPPYTPECNPVEHVWDEVREKGFANRLFQTLDAVEVALRTQLDLLAADSPRLRTLTYFPWIREGLLYL